MFSNIFYSKIETDTVLFFEDNCVFYDVYFVDLKCFGQGLFRYFSFSRFYKHKIAAVSVNVTKSGVTISV